jgi:methionyl-tRNA synthetase
VVPASGTATPAEQAIAAQAQQTIAEFGRLFADFQFSRALEVAWSLVGIVDKYIVENAPWSLGEKTDDASRARLATILYTSAEALRIVTALSHAVIPDSTARIWEQLGLGEIQAVRVHDLAWGQLKAGTQLRKVEPVFPRADKTSVERMHQMEEERRSPAPAEMSAVVATGTAAQATSGPAAAPAPVDGKITIDDFTKIELRVGLVKVAERVKGADKLLRLEIDIGTEVRQILAGIAEAYDPEPLVGRKVVIVANLAPRKLRGLESNGMIVAASLEGGKPVLAGFLEDVPVGARLK